MPLTAKNILRVVRFRPYARGKGPVFRLITWDTHRCRGCIRGRSAGRCNCVDSLGKSILGYRLSIGEQHDQNVVGNPAVWRVLFDGEDFGCSPLHAIDSNATIAGIMGFLTLRPGDTDADYFADYTPKQLEYCSQHAESLACAVHDRYGEF